MSRVPDGASGAELFAEKDFYLEEFRGRSVLLAVDPSLVPQRPDLTPLARTITELVRNGTRVLIWWPAAKPSAERRLLAALGRARALSRRAGVRRPPAPLVRTTPEALEDTGLAGTLRADVWEHLRQRRLCVVAVRGAARFPAHATGVAQVLRLAKLVLIDDEGGLVVGGTKLSFVDANVLDTILRDGEAEWSGLGARRDLLAAVRSALASGVESVNLCPLDGVAEELFSYEGSGTLFTAGDYCRVSPLGLDDFAQAERLLERGQREGLLKMRAPEEIGDVLASGFGATIGERHLVGVVGLLTAPYASERAGEIVGLYTITRFKGEGIGDRLVARLVHEATERGLAYVFAVALDARAQQFFLREGFSRVDPDDVPAGKWDGYDVRRLARVGVFRRDIGAAPPAGRG